MPARALLIAVLGVVAITVAALLTLRAEPDAGAASSRIADLRVDGNANLADQVASTAGGDGLVEVDVDAPQRAALGEVVGRFYVQVDEVDRCIDPNGTGLVLVDERDQVRYEARVDEGGAAVFDGVQVDGNRRRFALFTSVADRACFPTSIQLGSGDFEGDPPRAGLSLSLVHLHNLELRTVDAVTGSPIEGARVQLDSFTAVAPTHTGEDGRCVLNLGEPSGTIIATAEGYHEALWNYPEILEDGTTWLHDRAELELQPDRITSFLDVVVVDGGGVPVPGAEVDVVELERCALPRGALAAILPIERMAYLDALDAERVGLGAVRGRAGDLAPTVTNTEGVVQFRILYPCRMMVRVRAGGMRGRTPIEVVAGDRRRVTIVLEESASLRFEITGREREPLGGLFVHARLEFARGQGYVIEPPQPSVSDERGVVVLSGLDPEARYRVWVADSAAVNMTDGEVDYRGDVQAPGPGEVRRVPVQIDSSSSGTLRGRVVDAVSGDPVAGARVVSSQSGISDTNGRFAIPWVAHDTVTVSARGFRTARVAVDSVDQEIGISLVGVSSGYETSLALSVVDEAGVEVVVDGLAIVRVLGPDGYKVSDESETGSRYVGTPTLFFKRDLLDGEELSIDVRCLESPGSRAAIASYQLRPGEQRRERLTVRRLVAVRGSVIFADGIPAPGVTIQIRLVGPGELSRVRQSKEIAVAGDGRFATELPQGRYRFQTTAGFHTARTEVVLRPGAPVDVRLVLEPSREIYVLVRDAGTGDVVDTSPRTEPVVVGPGRRRVQVRASGYRSRTVWIDKETPPVLEVVLERIR